jgi:hypothetical protein
VLLTFSRTTVSGDLARGTGCFMARFFPPPTSNPDGDGQGGFRKL